MNSFLGTALSPHLAKLPDGGLLVRGSALARTGEQSYLPSEVFPDSRDIPEYWRGKSRIDVTRLPEEVFSVRTMSSAEGATLCDGHPSVFISPQNFRVHACGHIQNVRRAAELLLDGNEALIGDLLVRDPVLAQSILAGQKRQLSLGYDCDYQVEADGRTITQRNLVINHAAVCVQGRAGSAVAITDEQPLLEMAFAKLGTSLARAYDALPALRPSIDEFFEDLTPAENAASDAAAYARAMREHWRR